MSIIKNIQFQQFINLLLLLYIAYINHTLQTSTIFIFSLALFAVFFEAFLNYLKEDKIYLSFSAIITAFGIVLMVGWSKAYIPFILVAAALLQKRFIKIENRHIFNPSNFAMIFALTFFYPKALPIVGQVGDEGYILTFVIALGILILIRANRILISLSFILFYTLLEYFIIGYSDPHFKFSEFVTKFHSISFIVYILFMLTDPITTPNENTLQIAFGFVVALIIVLLDYFVGVHIRNIFIGLFLSSIIFIPLYRNIENKIQYLLLFFLSILAVFKILSTKPMFFNM